MLLGNAPEDTLATIIDDETTMLLGDIVELEIIFNTWLDVE
jgi:hypothetical protein